MPLVSPSETDPNSESEKSDGTKDNPDSHFKAEAMNNNPESENPDDDGFDLVAPTGRMKYESEDRPPAKENERGALPVPPPVGALEDKKGFDWK